MKISTLNIIKSVLEGDDTIAPAHRKTLLQRLQRPDEPVEPSAPKPDRVVPRKEAAYRCGNVHVRTIDAWVREGLLIKCVAPGRSQTCGVLESSIDRLVERMAGGGK